MLDNIKIATFTKLNELAERHGLKAYDFVATLKDGPGFDLILDFEWPAEGNKLREQRYDNMLRDLGIPEGRILQGTDAHIIDSLDHALDIAPQTRRRF